MKTQIRLNSVVADGVGSGPESAAIDLIYAFLLSKLKQDIYSYISINQIDNKLDEVITKKGKKIHINVRYPTVKNFSLKGINEKNMIRLDIIHEGFVRIAKKYKELDIQILESIKKEIVDKHFLFEIVCKEFQNKNLTAKIIVHPKQNSFKYFVSIENAGVSKCNILIYNGRPGMSYFLDFFKYGKWLDENKIIITGEKKSVEIHIFLDKCNVEYINLTPYNKSPFFELMKSGLTDEEYEKANKDYNHSLAPHIAAVIRNADN